MSDDIIRFSVEGAPRGKGRPRTTHRRNKVHIYTDAKTQNYEDLVSFRAMMAMKGRKMLVGPVIMRMTAYYAIPKATSNKKALEMEEGFIVPCKKPDIDNLLKIIADGCNGIVYKDDAQIVTVLAKKRYAEEARVDVEVTNY
jgi:Holliday junction resolvase RusA-like endonuclease